MCCLCGAQLLLKASVSVADIADYIIAHNYIGSVIKVGYTGNLLADILLSFPAKIYTSRV